MRVAIVENTRITHHGQIGVALHEAGAKIDQYRPYADQPLPEAGFEALVVFGGEQSALDDAAHPYLPGLAALMRRASEAGLAVLGVCLGAQVLARAFGATNQLGLAREFGWQQVTQTEAGRSDPLLRALPATFPSFQWHTDTFSLPPGAQHLARSDIAPVQAFRIGRATWGTQFHFEANGAVVTDWTQEFPARVDAMEAGFTAAMPARRDVAAQADSAGLAIARAFVAQIRG